MRAVCKLRGMKIWKLNKPLFNYYFSTLCISPRKFCFRHRLFSLIALGTISFHIRSYGTTLKFFICCVSLCVCFCVCPTLYIAICQKCKWQPTSTLLDFLEKESNENKQNRGNKVVVNIEET